MQKDEFLNARLSPEQAAELDSLVTDDTTLTGVKMDRSKTAKRLIHQEYIRRKECGIIVVELPGPEDADRPALIGVKS
jgi:hypothetical protein